MAGTFFLGYVLEAVFGAEQRQTAVVGAEQRQTFVAELCEQRWDALVASGDLTNADAAGVGVACECATDGLVVATGSAQSVACTAKHTIVSDDALLTKLRARAHEAAEILRRITPASVKRISLGNYVEHVAAAVAGADGVYPFLTRCLLSNPPSDQRPVYARPE